MIHATAFETDRCIARGPLPDVARAVHAAQAANPTAALLVFDDATARVIDLDLRGTAAEVVARLQPEAPKRAGRGRPALGVVPREITLLPAQWDWLTAQSRNVSAVLRRLVDDARRATAGRPPRKHHQEMAYRFLTTMAGDRPGYEEAIRALFADRADVFRRHSESWPADIRDHALRLAAFDEVRSPQQPVLIILGGSPGSGKTTVARALARQTGALHLRVDMIEQALREMQGGDIGAAGYAVAQRLATDHLRAGLSVVADSVNPVAASRTGWRDTAQAAGTGFVEVEIHCSDRARHRQRLEKRESDIPGLVPPDWDAVQTLNYEEWSAVRRFDSASTPPEDVARHIADYLAPSTVSRYIEPTQAAGAAFVRRGIEGPVVMLNLLRFREQADYRAHPDLAPPAPISGAAAFDRYIGHTLPYLRESGGEVLFLGKGGPFLIGPEAERWDCAMLIRQASVDSFLAFANHAGYRAGLGHRVAALLDSRLLPLEEYTRGL